MVNFYEQSVEQDFLVSTIPLQSKLLPEMLFLGDRGPSETEKSVTITSPSIIRNPPQVLSYPKGTFLIFSVLSGYIKWLCFEVQKRKDQLDNARS